MNGRQRKVLAKIERKTVCPDTETERAKQPTAEVHRLETSVQNDFLLSFLGNTFCFSCLPSRHLLYAKLPSILAACHDLPMCRM